MKTVEIPDINGEMCHAVVGNKVIAYDTISQRLRVDTIQGIKNGFKLSNMKVQPKPADCILIEVLS